MYHHKYTLDKKMFEINVKFQADLALSHQRKDMDKRIVSRKNFEQHRSCESSETCLERQQEKKSNN